jgi:hypothetical protein
VWSLSFHPSSCSYPCQYPYNFFNSAHTQTASSPYSSTLKMEATDPSQMSANFYQPIQCHITYVKLWFCYILAFMLLNKALTSKEFCISPKCCQYRHIYTVSSPRKQDHDCKITMKDWNYLPTANKAFANDSKNSKLCA